MKARGMDADECRSPSGTTLEIVVVTYASEILIRSCLRSAIAHTPDGTLIRVVDNASPDNTVTIVKQEFPDVVLSVRPSNAGFAVANNVALKHVQSPFVLLLNPDAELAPGVVDHLLTVMNEEPDAGILGCRLVTADGTLDHAAKRFIPTPLEAGLYFAGRLVGRRVSRYTAPSVAEFGTGDVDAVNGAFMLVRRAAMDEVGLFDESFWMYGEDLDWCTRFRKAGWRVIYDGRVTAWHLKGGSAGVRSWRLNFAFHRSMVIYQRKHASSSVALRALIEVLIWAKFIATASADAVRRRLPGRPR